jgi:hypothetical protein
MKSLPRLRTYRKLKPVKAKKVGLKSLLLVYATSLSEEKESDFLNGPSKNLPQFRREVKS